MRKINPMRHAAMSAVAKPAVSELILSDRLITLAKDAERAGYADTAAHLLTLACSVFDDAPNRAVY
jgi:hypothetical protein